VCLPPWGRRARRVGTARATEGLVNNGEREKRVCLCGSLYLFEVKVALSPKGVFFKSKTTYLRETLERAWAHSVCAGGFISGLIYNLLSLSLSLSLARARARSLSLSAAHTPHTTPPRWSLHLSDENERSADLHRK